jgi:hypothetical protein
VSIDTESQHAAHKAGLVSRGSGVGPWHSAHSSEESSEQQQRTWIRIQLKAASRSTATVPAAARGVQP